MRGRDPNEIQPYYLKIVDIVATQFEVTKDQVLGRGRHLPIVKARHMVVKLLLDLGFNAFQIAKFKKVDHTTVLNSIRNIDSYYYNPSDYSRYTLCKQLSSVIPKPFDDPIEPDSVAYISGMVTGLPVDYARAKFSEAEAKVSKKHDRVINPYKVCEEKGIDDWRDCMQTLLPMLHEVSVLYVMQDYTGSKGALWEIAYAQDIVGAEVRWL
jgi:hypothetical protein